MFDEQMNEMGEWKNNQRHNLGSSVEDREEVPLYCTKWKWKNSQTLCPKKYAFHIISHKRQFSTACHLLNVSLLPKEAPPHHQLALSQALNFLLMQSISCTRHHHHPYGCPPWPMPQVALLYQGHAFSHGTLKCANVISFVRLTHWVDSGRAI